MRQKKPTTLAASFRAVPLLVRYVGCEVSADRSVTLGKTCGGLVIALCRLCRCWFIDEEPFVVLIVLKPGRCDEQAVLERIDTTAVMLYLCLR